MTLKRFLLPAACLCAAALMTSCIVNTSAKLDSIGKTHEGYYFDATRPTTCLFKQNGKYYVKAPIVRFPASTKIWQPKPSPDDTLATGNSSRITNITSWGYHEIFTTDPGSIDISKGNFHPILLASGSWIPAEQFERLPFTAMGNPTGIKTNRKGDILNADAVRITETHRSVGNILRLPLVLIAGCAVDIPGSLLVLPFMSDSDEGDDEDSLLDSLIDDAIDKACKKHKHKKKH